MSEEAFSADETSDQVQAVLHDVTAKLARPDHLIPELAFEGAVVVDVG